MTFDLSSITRETTTRPPRILITGVEKIGKSSFAAGSDSPVILPVKGEEGVDALNVAKFPVVNSINDLKEALYTLYTEPHDYQTAVIDSVSALEPLVWADVCLRHHAANIESVMGGYGKGYGQAVDVWRGITEALDALRNDRQMCIILIGHAKIKRFDSPDAGSWDQWQIDLHDKAASLLYRWIDVALFANTKVVVKAEDAGFNKQTKRAIDISGGRRYLYTAKSPAYSAGGRGIYGRLPAELDLSWESFTNAVYEAMRNQEATR